MTDSPKIIEFIREELPNTFIEFDGQTSLFQAQLLDSISLVNLIAFLEEQYQIKVAPSDISYENFDTVELITQYIQNKQKDPKTSYK